MRGGGGEGKEGRSVPTYPKQPVTHILCGKWVGGLYRGGVAGLLMATHESRVLTNYMRYGMITPPLMARTGGFPTSYALSWPSSLLSSSSSPPSSSIFPSPPFHSRSHNGSPVHGGTSAGWPLGSRDFARCSLVSRAECSFSSSVTYSIAEMPIK